MVTILLSIFILYLFFMIGIGIFFFVRTRQGGEKTDNQQPQGEAVKRVTHNGSS